MSPEPHIETATDEPDDLADGEVTEEGRDGLLFLNHELEASAPTPAPAEGGSPLGNRPVGTVPGQTLTSPTSPPGFAISIGAAVLASAIHAVRLPPSELASLLKSDSDDPDKPPKPLHRISLTLDAGGLRLTNQRRGVTVEVTAPIRSVEASGESDALLVPMASLEGLFPARPVRSGAQRLDKIDWRTMPDVKLAYSPKRRRLTLRLDQSTYGLDVQPCALPSPLEVPGDAPFYHGIVPAALARAVLYARTYSARALPDDPSAVISVEGGVARGGSRAAATSFECGLINGITAHISVSDVALVCSVLGRIGAFQMAENDGRLLLRDGHLTAAVEQAKDPFPDLRPGMRRLEQSGGAVKVRLWDLYKGAVVASLLQPRETDRHPCYVEASYEVGKSGPSVILKGRSPAGDRARTAVPALSSPEAEAPPATSTVRAAHLKRAASPERLDETGTLILADRAVMLVVERHGGTLRHVISAPAKEKGRPAQQDRPRAETAD